MALSLNMFQLTDSEIVYLHSPASIMSHFRYRQWEKACALYWCVLLFYPLLYWTLLNLTLRCCWAQFTGLASGIWLYCHQFWRSIHSILQNCCYFVLQVCSSHIWIIFLLKSIEEKKAYHPTSQSVWMIANIQKI